MSKPLTVKFVENCRPGEKRIETPDGDMPGLRLIVQTTGIKSWAYYYRFGGVKKKLTFGRFPAIRLADARDLARSAARALAEGNDPAEKKKAAKETPIIFEDVAKRFLLRECKPNYAKRYFVDIAHDFGFKLDKFDPKGLTFIRNTYKRAFVEKWGKRPIASIIEQEIVDFLDDIVDEGNPTTANNFHTALRLFFKWAKSPSGRRVITVNPCIEVKQPAPDNERERTLSQSELRALWHAAGRLKYPEGTAYRLLMLTGQRKTIVRKCTTKQINRREEIWEISAHQEGAKGTGHILPITDAIAAIFDECGAAAPYLLSTTGGELPIYLGDKIKKKIDILMLEELRKEAKEEGRDPKTIYLQNWTNHDIRRTMRTMLSALPVPQGEIVNELVIGHRKKKLHRTYDKYAYLPEKRIALDLWATKLESIVNPQPGNVVTFKARVAS